MPMQEVDEDFLDTFEIDLVVGRNKTDELPQVPSDENQKNVDVLLTESAVKMLGWDDSGSASETGAAGPVGQRMSAVFWRGNLTVIGVVKDFHFRSLHERMGPTGLYFRKGHYSYLALRIRTEDLPATVRFMEQTWNRFVHDAPFEFEFLDDRLALAYDAEVRLGRIFSVFSGLAIFVACLGLFGLAAFTAEQRTREIGVRKVLGASSTSIVMMLSREFVKLVAIANLVAWPVSYLLMDEWLQSFAYRITMGWELFALSGVLAALIAVATVGYQAARASRANPIDALRT